MSARFTVTYHVRAAVSEIDARAQAIAVEQSVEMPLAAIDDTGVLTHIVGQVEDMEALGSGRFSVRIGLATATVGRDAGQFLNMVFGNTSLHEDVVLADIGFPEGLFTGPRHGIAGLRSRLGVRGRAMAASALKPQGLPPERLALLAERMAAGGLDVIKDDHGLADQRYAPFADRVRACAAAVARATRRTGHPTRYVPSLTGDLDALRSQARLAQEEGLDCVMLAPMVAGLPAMQALTRAFPALLFVAHPSMGGAARIAPDLLIGGLFPALGADAVIFPNHGGRFGYSPETCRRLAKRARAGFGAIPVPAGGMTLARVPEILDFYGPETMLLIGGSLLSARGNLTAETERFVRVVAEHDYGRE
jgi:ribulose-bisphosphate carboxylase large chain